MYFVGIELSYVWQTDTCLSFPHFCSAIDKNTTYVGLDASQEIYIVYWSPKLFPEVFRTRSDIWHHSKCHTPFGLTLYHLTVGLFLHLPITNATNCKSENKKERKKGAPIPPSRKDIWRGKLTAQDMVWRSTSPWLHLSLQFPSALQQLPTREHRDTSAGSMQTPSVWHERDRYRHVPVGHYW